MSKRPYEFRGNAYRKIDNLDAWTRQRREDALEPDLPIIDPHHHILDDERGRYLLDEFAADVRTGHNIVSTVVVECGSMYRADGAEAEKPVGEVEFLNGVAAMSANGRYGKARIAGIVGHADLMLGDNVQPVLEALIAAGNGRLRGIRHGMIWDVGNAARFGRHQVSQHQMLDPAFRRGFARLHSLGLSFDVWIFHPQLPDLADLLRAAPDANVVLCHSGGVLGIAPHQNRSEAFRLWAQHIHALAKFPNLTIKVGGLGMLYCGWEFHLNDLPPSSEELATAWRPYVETCIEAFGVNRCMMESNFPVDKQSCAYGELWNALKRITRECSSAEKAALYRDTAARVYRLPP